MPQIPADLWNEGDPYERYVGRWSRCVAAEFVDWLSVPAGSAWVDVGCGTGALTGTVLRKCAPSAIHGVDSSSGFLATARARLTDPRVRFHVADATSLPLAGASCDVTVSGLVLNFIREPARMVAEMRRVNRPGGWIAAYVWDYAQGMQMMRLFWDAARIVVPAAATMDEADRFPICSPQALQAAWETARLEAVEVRSILIDTTFRDFDDFWTPFLGAQGAAPTYLATLAPAHQEAIRDALSRALPRDSSRRIPLTARAWAVKGRIPDLGRGGS